ncbi:hypothetical protein B1R32_1056 [Abditibacterium utsteinense]|uniref:Secretin/TonB short N-terminal domain-containing protein n=1 Tax=Abditibacterium utsteinense TaxID=1960156 RepID=A0A2S8SU53_9BACT|nr:hypothetical protein [Abditibacterium utsteinense]PQV64325.1 hypothetical protein B1R32_1056 [Abditibacterium utsteinense]
MIGFRSRLVLSAAALLCASAVVVRADEAPVAPSLATQPTISLVATSSASTADVATFLKAPVSFSVKDASFLSALDAVLLSSGKNCFIECREVKPMKMSFSIRSSTAGRVLDALARAGGCTLYVLPTKLLIAPASLLEQSERAEAKPFTVLVSAATLPAGKTLPKQANGVDMLALANKNISVSIQGLEPANAMSACRKAGPILGAYTHWSTPRDRLANNIQTSLTLSFDQIPFAEALSVVGELGGCQLYLLPDTFHLRSPDQPLTPEEKKLAVPAFITNFPSGPSAPSA